MFKCRFLAALLLLSSVSLAQTQFAGRWQTRTNAAGKRTVTISIVVHDSVVSGEVVFLDNHGEYRMPIAEAHSQTEILEFETKGERGDIWSWRLILRGKRKGFLHGSIGEMLIDERVRRAR